MFSFLLYKSNLYKGTNIKQIGSDIVEYKSGKENITLNKQHDQSGISFHFYIVI